MTSPKQRKISTSVLHRTGIIDIGSNTVRLVVFEGPSRSPRYFYNEKVNCGLGVGLLNTKRLNPKGVRKTIKALRRFKSIIAEMNLKQFYCIATAAVRESVDGSQFVNQLEEQFRIKIWVVSGEEEGNLAASGVLMGWPEASGIVCDIGGASLELAYLNSGMIQESQSFGLGPLTLNDYQQVGKVQANIIYENLSLMKEGFPNIIEDLFLVGGCWRALARIHMNINDYPLKVLQGYKISVDSLNETMDFISSSKISILAKTTSSSMDRLELLPNAIKVLQALINRFKPKSIIFSGYGIREGFFYKQFSSEIREMQPLLEACKYLENTRARFPGFGEALYDWLRPIVPDINEINGRLYLAACYLHDTIWQAHPDYRSEVCFETVTGANLGGIDHEGRVFLALSLMSRYKRTNLNNVNKDMLDLLDQNTIRKAMILGASMRLGSMLSVTVASNLKKTKIFLEGKNICLSLREKDNFLGETVEKRLSYLAQLMDLNPKIIVE